MPTFLPLNTPVAKHGLHSNGPMPMPALATTMAPPQCPIRELHPVQPIHKANRGISSVTFAAVNESVATPVRQPYYMAQERPSSHVAATNLSITPLVPPLVRPPTPTTLSTTYSSSTVPLSASSAQSHGPLSSAAHPVTAPAYPPLVDGGNFPHPQRQRYPLRNQLQLRHPEAQFEPWDSVYDDDDRARTVRATYPLGSSSSNIPHSSFPATHAPAPAELPASTTVRDRVGRVTRKRKNEGKENASNSNPVPSRKRRRLRDEHHAHGPPDDILLDSSSGRGVMTPGQPVAASLTDTGGYPLPHTDPGTRSLAAYTHTMADSTGQRYRVGISHNGPP